MCDAPLLDLGAFVQSCEACTARLELLQLKPKRKECDARVPSRLPNDASTCQLLGQRLKHNACIQASVCNRNYSTCARRMHAI